MNEQQDFDWENCMYRQQYRNLARLLRQFHLISLSGETKERMRENSASRQRYLTENYCEPNGCQRCRLQFVEDGGVTPPMTKEEKEHTKQRHARAMEKLKECREKRLDHGLTEVSAIDMEAMQKMVQEQVKKAQEQSEYMRKYHGT